MNVLLIGSGGREHALAWALSASPLLTKLVLCARQCRHRRGRRVRRARRRRSRRRHRASAASNAIDFVVVGPEAPLVAGLADDLAAAGIKVFGPSQGGGPARRLEGLHQGSLPRVRHPDRRLRPLHGCGRRAKAYLATPATADRRQGRRPRRRQGRRHRRDAGPRPRRRSTPASPAPSARPAPRS